ncbi:MAG: ABC transporter permease [Acidobacteria bacterium]|jgi:ABC-type transport system involved in multi-copper enzyme maturation permease subunit|nr:ABC transporter permease [Acidobacteriota bacterium]
MAGNIHLKQSIRGIWLKFLLLFIALFIFELLFSLLGASAEVQQNMLKKMKDIPPVVEKIFGEGFSDAILKYGIIAFGYIHPLVLGIFIIFIFAAISQIVTAEVSSGTIGYTLSKPVSRKRIYFNLAFIIYIGLGLLALSAYASSALGILIFHHGKLPTGSFASLSWNLFLIMVFIAGYMVILAAQTETGKALFTWGGVILLAFYIIDLAAPLWQPLELFSPVNPFSYYNPLAILVGGRISLVKSVSLFTVSVIMFTIGGWLFNRRDIFTG